MSNIIKNIIEKVSPHVTEDTLKKILNSKKYFNRVIKYVQENQDDAEDIAIMVYLEHLMGRIKVNDIEFMYQEALRFFNDLKLIDGGIHLLVEDREDFVDFFKKDSQDYARSVLTGDVDLYFYSDWMPDEWTVDHELTHLNPKYQEKLKLLIAKDMEDVMGEFFEYEDEEVELTGEHIKTIINGDLSSIISLVFANDTFEEIKEKLQRMSNRATECGRQQVAYNHIMEQIESLFPGELKPAENKGYYVKIDDNLFENALHHTIDDAIYADRGFVSNYNQFYDVINEYLYESGEELDAEHSDYVDTDIIVKCIESYGIEEYYMW